MTTVRSTLDLWRSYSLSPYEVCHFVSFCNERQRSIHHQEPSDSTLAEFLVENEGKRCVVVLDVRLTSFVTSSHLPCSLQEIEKTEDPKTLHSLLMPWELGGFQTCTLLPE